MPWPSASYSRRIELFAGLAFVFALLLVEVRVAWFGAAPALGAVALCLMFGVGMFAVASPSVLDAATQDLPTVLLARIGNGFIRLTLNILYVALNIIPWGA